MPDRYLDDRGFVIGTEPDDALPAHLHPDAVAGCTLCDPDGYRGATICDHVEHYVETATGRALVHAELAKISRRKTDRAHTDTHSDGDSPKPGLRGDTQMPPTSPRINVLASEPTPRIGDTGQPKNHPQNAPQTKG